VYGSLLETQKPYLCNVFAMPALQVYRIVCYSCCSLGVLQCGQTALLCAARIFTDVTATRLLVDGWLLFDFDGYLSYEYTQKLFAYLDELRISGRNCLGNC
jgi:hypothetical protein